MPNVKITPPNPTNYMIRDLSKFDQDYVYTEVRMEKREPNFYKMAEKMMSGVKYKPELLSYRMAMMTAEIFDGTHESWNTKRNWIKFINYLHITGNRK